MRSLILLALIGCRSYAVPVVPQPALPPDPVLEAKSSTAQVKTGTRDVCDGESRCRTEDTTREEERSEVRMNGKLLSYGQVRLIDPAGNGQYASQLAEYSERSKPCRSARKYKIAGIATTVVGGVVALINNISTPLRYAALAVAGGGVVLIVIGYQKSKGCDAVHRFYVESSLNIAEEVTIKDRKKEVSEIAARFNAQHGHAAP